MYAATLNDLVDLLEPRLAGALTEGGSLTRLRRVAASFPAGSVASFGFERPLGEDGAGTDFALCLSPRGVDWIGAQDCFQTLSVLVNAWRSVMAPNPFQVWLEFDTSRGEANLDAPSVFLSVETRDEGRAKLHDALQLLESLPEREGRGTKVSALVERCADACRGASRFQIGFMLSRESRGLRFCAMSLSREAALNFLEEIEWPGSLSVAAGLLDAYAGLCDGFGVQVQVARGVQPGAGFELLFRGEAQDVQPPGEPRWQALFKRLVADRLCTDGERRALLSWVSRTSFEAPLIERLIAGAFPSSELLLHGTFYTGLQHVKLVAGAHGEVRAKAYFGAALA